MKLLSFQRHHCLIFRISKLCNSLWKESLAELMVNCLPESIRIYYRRDIFTFFFFQARGIKYWKSDTYTLFSNKDVEARRQLQLSDFTHEIFFASSGGMQDLSSPTRDQTGVLLQWESGSVES